MEVLSDWCAALRLPAIWRRWDCRVGEHAAAHQLGAGATCRYCRLHALFEGIIDALDVMLQRRHPHPAEFRIGSECGQKASPGSGRLQPHTHWAAVLPLQLL